MTGRPTLVLLPGLLCDDRLWIPVGRDTFGRC
jgi:hypothetical protein